MALGSSSWARGRIAATHATLCLLDWSLRLSAISPSQAQAVTRFTWLCGHLTAWDKVWDGPHAGAHWATGTVSVRGERSLRSGTSRRMWEEDSPASSSPTAHRCLDGVRHFMFQEYWRSSAQSIS